LRSLLPTLQENKVLSTTTFTKKACYIMLSTTAEIQAALDVLRDDDIPFPFLAAKSLLVTHGVTSSRVSLSSLWENEIGFEKVMVVFGRNLL